MCGRFQASRSPAEIARWFKTTGPLPNVRRRYIAAPTQDVLVVLRNPESGERRLEALRWGLIPFWAKDVKIFYSTINATAENVATEPAFRDAFKRQRCLVPADGFYEWQKRDGNTKQPYRIVMADGSPMAFAGLWKRWTDPASGEAVRSFTILTIGANALCAPIHNRMPAIVDAVDWPTWLGEAPATSSGLKAVLRPPSAALMEAHMIRPRIGNVRNDDAAPINRVNSD
jgi:putative SOS response-associated peptidase YedK